MNWIFCHIQAIRIFNASSLLMDTQKNSLMAGARRTYQYLSLFLIDFALVTL